MRHNGLALGEEADSEASAAADLPPLPKAIGIDTKLDLSRHSRKASFNH